MKDRSFDAMARDAASVSRRRSLMTLGAAGLLAVRAGPVAADAKKASAVTAEGKKGHKKKKKNKQPAPDRCAPQVEPCNNFITTVCAGDPDCLDALQCCSHLATCDAGGFFSCVIISA